MKLAPEALSRNAGEGGAQAPEEAERRRIRGKASAPYTLSARPTSASPTR
jgi:hypothetical protein